MPLYDWQCNQCGKRIEEFRSLTDFCEKIMTRCDDCNEITEFSLIITVPAFEDWGSGRHFEDLAPKGMTFYSKSEYKKYLKAKGLREWEPKPGMPSNGRG